MDSLFQSLCEALRHLPALLVGLSGDANGGLSLNAALALASLPASIPTGVLLGWARAADVRPLSWVAWALAEFVKYTPLLLMVFWFHYLLPAVFGTHPPLFLTATAALWISGTAMVAEVFRSGIISVPKEEMESGLLCGLSRWQCARYILVPQALRTMLPAMLGVMVTLFKDTSLVFVIGIIELTQTGMLLSNRYPGELPGIYLLVCVSYMVPSLLLAWAERRLKAR